MSLTDCRRLATLIAIVSTTVRKLEADEAHALVPQLSSVLIDVVEGGASVSFMAPLERGHADDFWRRVAQGVATRGRILFGAFDGAELVGTAQLLIDLPPSSSTSRWDGSGSARFRTMR